MTTCTDKDKQTSSTYDIKGKKIIQARLKINKRHGMVMFVSMNTINNYALKPLSARAQHRKRLSVI